MKYINNLLLRFRGATVRGYLASAACRMLYNPDTDVLAIDCIGKVGETLGRGLAGLINICNPGLVVIGGRLIVGKKYLMYPIKTAVNKYSLNRVNSDTKIVYSTLGRKAASIGNCLIARSKYLGLF